MEATCSCKMFIDVLLTTQCYIPEDRTLQGVHSFQLVYWMGFTELSLRNIAWNPHITENAHANLQLCVWWIMAILLVKLVLHSHRIFSQPVTTLHCLGVNDTILHNWINGYCAYTAVLPPATSATLGELLHFSPQISCIIFNGSEAVQFLYLLCSFWTLHKAGLMYFCYEYNICPPS
jgi:hypothetical protein